MIGCRASAVLQILQIILPGLQPCQLMAFVHSFLTHHVARLWGAEEDDEAAVALLVLAAKAAAAMAAAGDGECEGGCPSCAPMHVHCPVSDTESSSSASSSMSREARMRPWRRCPALTCGPMGTARHTRAAKEERGARRRGAERRGSGSNTVRNNSKREALRMLLKDAGGSGSRLKCDSHQCKTCGSPQHTPCHNPGLQPYDGRFSESARLPLTAHADA